MATTEQDQKALAQLEAVVSRLKTEQRADGKEKARSNNAATAGTNTSTNTQKNEK